MDTLLNLTIFLPILGLLGVLVVRNENLVKWISLVVTTATFIISLPLMLNFNSASSETAQFVFESGSWLPGLDVKYIVGLDGLSLLLFMLTTFIGPIVVISAWHSVEKHVTGFYAMLLILETASLGVFASLDLFMFYIFFELSLIPMYFLIGIWGGKGRIEATLKFFIYTLVGSLIMLVALIYLGYDAGNVVNGGVFTTDWRLLSSSAYMIDLGVQTYLFFAFALAFCIKVPLFPFHTWLPYAHTEAPTAGSVVLAAIMLKMGTYGLLRVLLPIFPNATYEFAPYFGVLAVIGIIYGALVAMVQKDVKKLVAYSSVSHLGFVVLGVFALNTVAIQGAILQMVNHGLSTGALFLIVGMIYDRRHTRMISDFGGISSVMPVFAVMFMIATMASIGLPGLNGFVGEFLILNGSFQSEALNSSWFTIISTSGVILAAVYMLWMFRRVMFGSVVHEANKSLVDLNAREIGLLVPLMLAMFWIGFYPSAFTKYSEKQVNVLLQESIIKKEKTVQVFSAQSTDWVKNVYELSENLEVSEK
ncbi:NADH-quinone oxidoreductase subunit M [bacterium]|nr:MAG: NADH-quinone oxidoreductase subunit M [bacterium]